MTSILKYAETTGDTKVLHAADEEKKRKQVRELFKDKYAMLGL